MMDRNEQFLAQIAAERPELVEDVDALSTLYRKKLWHELSVKLEELVQTERFQRDGILLSLYQNFIASFSSHINLLKLASFAVAAAKQIQNPEVRARAGHGKDLLTGCTQGPAGAL